MKSVNYKIGALKRKFKTGAKDQEPGTFIQMSKIKKDEPTQEMPKIRKEKVAFMGLV